MKKSKTKIPQRQREQYRGVTLIARAFRSGVQGKAWCNGEEIASVESITENSVIELLREHVDRSIVVETAENATPYPAASKYALSLSRNRDKLTNKQLAMLRAHRDAPNRILSEESLTEAAECKRWSSARSQYAILGRWLGESMLFQPLDSAKNSPAWIRIVTYAAASKEGNSSGWELRAELAEALDNLAI